MEVEAEAGEAFDIRVEQYGTAGYQWHVEPLPAGMVLVTERTASPTAEAPPGDPAQRVFTFRADQPGRYRIELIAKRAWETQPASHRTFEVTVT